MSDRLIERFTSNPWFDIVDGELVLHEPSGGDDSPTPAEERERRLKNLLGYSALADALLADYLEGWWYLNEKAVRVHPEGKGVELALKLVERIAEKCRERSCRLLFVLQGSQPDAGSTAVLDRARSLGIHVLDLVTLFLEEERADPTVRARYFDGHMTAEGNRWVASRVWQAIGDSGPGRPRLTPPTFD